METRGNACVRTAFRGGRRGRGRGARSVDTPSELSAREPLEYSLGSRQVMEYADKFDALTRFIPDLVSTDSRWAEFFFNGLNNSIKGLMASEELVKYDRVLRGTSRVDISCIVSSVRMHVTWRGIARMIRVFAIGVSSHATSVESVRPDSRQKIGALNNIGHLKQLQSLGTLNLFRADQLTEEGSFDAVVGASLVNIAAKDPEVKNNVEHIVLTSSAAAVSVKLKSSKEVGCDGQGSLVGCRPSHLGETADLVSKVMVEKEASS
ncbi:hypothetical protein Cni_G18940 [Canna indica]|uniref:Uncharacterized protein n=1 Tax=Canna indica TaxID=4628 RepID=A0AAQ3QI33_9LILI|nr:hypothetical protein Cni_G18940 [Canna indica]